MSKSLVLPLVAEATDVAAARNASSGASTGVRIVDLRPSDAFLAGHPADAVHLESALLNRSAPPVGGLLPDRKTVEQIAATIGLAPDTHIVACDAGASTEAARLIWVLHAYGIRNCSWLNGGFAAWQAAGLPIEQGESATPAASGAALARVSGDDENVVTADALLGELADEHLAIIDVRGAGEFAGIDVRAAAGGHVPGAVHLEWTRMLGPDGRLLPDAELHALLAEAHIATDRKAVVYCQTHQRSAVTYVALKHLGLDSVRALDGAWSLWGNRPDLPKEV